MRVGQNPIKAVERIEPPAPVTVVVVSYIPFLSGYYTHSLDLLKLCLNSLNGTTHGDYDLMVFDNGSCAEAINFLTAEQIAGRIQFLVLSSRNLGKPAAWNFAFAAAPGELVAYADGDVYFHKGWLDAGLNALNAFPQAGMVTAMPVLTPEKFSTSTISWAKKQDGVKIESGQLLPWQDFWRHARSLGDTEENARRFYADNKAVRLTYKGENYYAGAAHFQFIARKTVLQEILPIPAKRPMGQVRLLDEAINAKGYLRLSTEKWYVQHLGNQLPLPADLVYPGSLHIPKSKRPADRKGIWQLKPIRRVLQWVNGWSFERLRRSR